MKLKYQLLLLGLLSLIFPITGWYALKSVDNEFRKGLINATNNNLTSLQASVSQIVANDESLNLSGLVLAELTELTLNGYESEWHDIKAYVFSNNRDELSFKIARYANQLALLVKSNDRSIKINPTNYDKNDYILLGIVDESGMHQYKFYRQAEGTITPKNNSQNSPFITAIWHENSNGYILELALKHSNISHLGIASINIWTNADGMQKTITGTLEDQNNTSLKLLPIVSHQKKMQLFIDSITPHNNHFIISDQDKRIIYQKNKLPDSTSASPRQWLITPLYSWLFGKKNATNQPWFYRESDGMAGVIATKNLGGISYQLKSMMPEGQQSMIQTLLKASLAMILVVLLLVLAYLMYSLWLAWRIRRLNNALHKVLDESGQLTIEMPSSQAQDEIGQLAQGIESMLSEMQEYTSYLKELGSRLSHEMKTPLAIVQSSLDNLVLTTSKGEQVFLTRALDGLHRLKFILTQLSQLGQLKHSLETTTKQKINLTTLCTELGQAYQSYIPQLKLNTTRDNIFINGSNELLSQLIDKLIDNAVDFTPPDGDIVLKLQQKENRAYLSVTNTGSQLPKGINVFASMQSQRKEKTENAIHLGLGLYLAQLIARFHATEIQARNHISLKTVEFYINFKLI